MEDKNFNFKTVKEVVNYVEARNGRTLSNFERYQALTITKTLAAQTGGFEFINKLVSEVEDQFAAFQRG